MTQKFHRITLMIVVLLSLTVVSKGQTADVTGIVRDSTQAVIANATVNLTNEDTGIKRTTVTNNLGYYNFSFVSPGNYRLTVQAKGFQTVNRTGLKMEVGQVARLDFSLQVGDVTAEVTVTDAAPLL